MTSDFAILDPESLQELQEEWRTASDIIRKLEGEQVQKLQAHKLENRG